MVQLEEEIARIKLKLIQIESLNSKKQQLEIANDDKILQLLKEHDELVERMNKMKGSPTRVINQKLKAEIDKTNSNLMNVKQSIEACKSVARTKSDKSMYQVDKISLKKGKLARGLLVSQALIDRQQQ